MTPISVGVSSSLSAGQTPDQSVDEASVPTTSVYHERGTNVKFTNSTWESPADLLVHENVEIVQDKEVSADTEEDAFSDWLQSYPESGPAEAAVDWVSIFGSGSASLSPDFDNYDVIPQRPRRPMVPIAIGCRDSSDISSPCQPPDGVSVFSPLSPPSAASIHSQFVDNISSPATRSTHEVKSNSAIAILTSESLASASEVQDDEFADVATSKTEVFAGGVGEHALSAWPSSYLEFDTGEDSKESYSAVHSDPVHAESDSNDECRVLAARTSSRVRKAIDSVREASNRYSDPSLLTAGPLEPHVSTPSSRDPQPSPLLESLSSSFDSVTSLSVFPSALSVSSSSLFAPSISPSSSRFSLCSTPASVVSLHDQVPFPPSISLFSFPSALSLPLVSLSVCEPSPVSDFFPVSLPCASVSDVFLSSSHSAEVCADSSVAHVHYFDAVQPSPIDRPPEDPPPNVAEELKDWFRAYIGLGIAEPTLLSASGPLPTSSNCGDFSGFLAPNDEFEEDPIPFANIVEDSPLSSQHSYNTIPPSQSVRSHPHPCAQPAYDEVSNDNERDFRSFNPLSSAAPSSTSSDDLRPTLGYVESSSSPATGLEINMLSLCSQESRDVVCACRSDSVLLARVDTLDSDLKLEFAQPFGAPILDTVLDYATHTPTGVVSLADLSPANEYDSQSEPEPPDPSCASH